MTDTNLFLKHTPEGTINFYEFHPERPATSFDYHQAYMGQDVAVSTLLTPEHQDWVTKAKAIKDKFSCEEARLYVEWDNPGDGELQKPAIFLDFGNWRVEPAGELANDGSWEDLFYELVQASGHNFSREDIPKCPDVSPFLKIAIGFFPARVKDEPWIRVVCNKTVPEAKAFAESMGFSTKWFEKFDIVKHCTTCLISFDVYKDRIEKPAAEMILLAADHTNKPEVPDAFAEFAPLYEQAKEMIEEAHGKHITQLRLCHFKVGLTDEAFEKGDAKMYLISSLVKSSG